MDTTIETSRSITVMEGASAASALVKQVGEVVTTKNITYPSLGWNEFKPSDAVDRLRRTARLVIALADQIEMVAGDLDGSNMSHGHPPANMSADALTDAELRDFITKAAIFWYVQTEHMAQQSTWAEFGFLSNDEANDLWEKHRSQIKALRERLPNVVVTHIPAVWKEEDYS